MNVTHEPYAWIVRLESQSQIATTIQQSDIPSRWIVEIELRNIGTIEERVLLCEDDEVVAVKMNRMSSRDLSLLSRLVREIRSIDNQIHIPGRKVVLPHRVERIVDVRRVLCVQDCRVTVVEEQRRVGQIPTKGAMRCSRVKIGSEGKIFYVALEIFDVPRNDRSEIRRALVNAEVATVVGVGRWSAWLGIVGNNASSLVILRYVTAALRDTGSDPVVAIRRRSFGFRGNNDLVSLSWEQSVVRTVRPLPIRLTYADEEGVCLERYDGHQVRLNHLKIMAVDRKDKHGCGRSIDQLHQIPLPLHEGLRVRGACELLSALSA